LFYSFEFEFEFFFFFLELREKRKKKKSLFFLCDVSSFLMAATSSPSSSSSAAQSEGVNIEEHMKTRSQANPYATVPLFGLEKSEGEVLGRASGPSLEDSENAQSGISVTSHFYGKTVSTYPVNSETGLREGDPICDQFGATLFNDGSAVLVVADGCNWGEKPREAAVRARDTFVGYMERKMKKCEQSDEVSHYLLRAMCKAHESILEGKSHPSEAGSTTLLGGVVMRVSEGSIAGGIEQPVEPLVFVAAAVGDCKAFLYRPDEPSIVEICAEETNRHRYAFGTRDPGGRLGPFVHAEPDLRNLTVFVQPLCPGDIVTLWSDGIYDNLDARHMGRVPSDLPGLERYGDSWDNVPAGDRDADATKNDFLYSHILQILKPSTLPQAPRDIAERLLAHCIQLTESSRDFMHANPRKRLPKDYKQYPGKLDHSTCIVLRIPDDDDSEEAESGNDDESSNDDQNESSDDKEESDDDKESKEA
jgi:serine/threonine protein phosphatase PrpC